MAVVNEQGITPKDLAGYKALLETRFKSEFGATLSVDPETPIGQIISVFSLAFSEGDEALVATANGMSVSHASGIQQNDLYSLLHIYRVGATFTTVVATLSGVAGTVVPAGSRAKTQEDIEFALVNEVTIPNGGSVDGDFISIEEGAVEVAAGQLTQIVNLISGWETVVNSLDGITGQDNESDRNYRTRYRRETAKNAFNSAEAMASALYEAGALDVRIEQNDTDGAVNRQTINIPKQSVMAIVLGGSNEDIAAAVLEHKPLGVAMAGDTAVARSGRFQRVLQRRVILNVNIAVTNDFPADGVSQIKQNLVDYADGRWEALVGQFDTSGFRIGGGVNTSRLQVPIYAVRGHTINSLSVQYVSGVVRGSLVTLNLPAVTPLHWLYTLAAPDITVTITR